MDYESTLEILEYFHHSVQSMGHLIIVCNLHETTFSPTLSNTCTKTYREAQSAVQKTDNTKNYKNKVIYLKLVCVLFLKIPVVQVRHVTFISHIN